MEEELADERKWSVEDTPMDEDPTEDTGAEDTGVEDMSGDDKLMLERPVEEILEEFGMEEFVGFD